MANLFELTSRLLEIKADETKKPIDTKHKQILTINKNGQYVITRHGKTGLFDPSYKLPLDPVPPFA